MKILRLLNNKKIFFLYFFFLNSISFAEDQPIDIWNIDKKKLKKINLQKKI